MKAQRKQATSFEKAYPNFAHLIDAIGYITIGHADDHSPTSFIRAIDPGGMVQTGPEDYPSSALLVMRMPGTVS
jgi:hypothetical protein